MKRLPRLLAVCCTAVALFSTAALAEIRIVTLSVSGMT
jgi:hypothetical protein